VDAMNVLIVGAGKSGSYLAEKLRSDHSVTMVESRPDRAGYVAARMPGVKVIRGDGCEPSVLDQAGAAQADLVAALTGDDEDNLVVSFLVKTTHQVPMVFARTNHPKNEWMFTKTWGVDVAVSTAQVIYSLIEKEVSLGDVITLMALSAENMVIDEVTLPADAEAVGKRLSELAIPKCAHVMAIISAGEVVVPRGDTMLNAGDEVLILSSCGEEANLRKTFGVRTEPK
jgi:trk system potassium uptake protein TrkA